ncbi:AAA-domain-containing protein [Rozella allomycis CSF55]|uniref:AAA-domain-containing protein n=1 Tax=Rozella allomycis (strain CSF55) TaxID=988480 RepID=A0A4P9YLS5_ROZAC|nr:AAA-domain-containing protein [Rozella allomycis CSF55]
MSLEDQLSSLSLDNEFNLNLKILKVDSNTHDLRIVIPIALLKDNFGIFDPVNVTFNETFAAGIIWPSKELKNNACYIGHSIAEALNCKEDDIVTIKKPKSVNVAQNVAITLMKGTVFDPCYIRDVLIDVGVVYENMVFTYRYNGKLYKLKVCQIKSNLKVKGSTLYTINGNTKISQFSDANDNSPVLIGGLDKPLNSLISWIKIDVNVYKKYGINPVKGILLHGSPGTGKTLLVKKLAQDLGYPVITVHGPSIMGQYVGETEKALREIFEDAKNQAPAILFMDELESLCPKRDQASSDVERRVVATLLTLMDGLDTKDSTSDDQRIIVIGATNRPNAIDQALRRPGRFDKELEIGIPNVDQRKDILIQLSKNIPSLLKEDDYRYIAERSHGYVGADLHALIREASFFAMERNQDSLRLTDFLKGMSHIKPSAMREIFLEVPKVKWEDIGGYDDVKKRLKEAVEWPLRYPESFKRIGVKPPKGILLYGPSGCSKTLMAKAVATEANLNFLAIKGPEIFNKYVGESEKAIRDIFAKARAAAPAIIFLDEFDAVAAKRDDSDSTDVSDRVVISFLNEMDGVESLENVTILAATNRPDRIDPAVLRPGRIDRMIYVGLPDFDARRKIFQLQFDKLSISSDVNIEDLVNMTAGYSGAEVVAICQHAGLNALQENINIEAVIYS